MIDCISQATIFPGSFDTMDQVNLDFTTCTCVCKSFLAGCFTSFSAVFFQRREQWRRQVFQTGGALHSMEDSRGGTRKNKRQKTVPLYHTRSATGP